MQYSSYCRKSRNLINFHALFDIWKWLDRSYRIYICQHLCAVSLYCCVILLGVHASFELWNSSTGFNKLPVVWWHCVELHLIVPATFGDKKCATIHYFFLFPCSCKCMGFKVQASNTSLASKLRIVVFVFAFALDLLDTMNHKFTWIKLIKASHVERRQLCVSILWHVKVVWQGNFLQCLIDKDVSGFYCERL